MAKPAVTQQTIRCKNVHSTANIIVPVYRHGRANVALIRTYLESFSTADRIRTDDNGITCATTEATAVTIFNNLPVFYI